FREAIDFAQANRRSRGRLRHSRRNRRWNELSRSPRQGCRVCSFNPERTASGVPGNANLSLPRPLDVGPGKLPDETRTGEISARRSDHAFARTAHARGKVDERTIRSARKTGERDGAGGGK